MARSANRPEPARGSRSGRRAPAAPNAVLEFVLRNPAPLGGGTAFLVALSFVSANAIWYQPHRHESAFFATRPPVSEGAPVPTALRPAAAAPAPDPTLKRVQEALKEAGFYGGPVDGLSGPATRKAIAAFQTANRLAVSGEPDAAFVAAIADQTTTTAAISPAQSPTPPEAADGGRELTRKIQAGLRAFGNEAIEVDGIMGARTQAAIREFQSLFGLAETGQPDAALYAKMKEVGLTN